MVDGDKIGQEEARGRRHFLSTGGHCTDDVCNGNNSGQQNVTYSTSQTSRHKPLRLQDWKRKYSTVIGAATGSKAGRSA